MVWGFQFVILSRRIMQIIQTPNSANERVQYFSLQLRETKQQKGTYTYTAPYINISETHMGNRTQNFKCAKTQEN